LAAIAAAVAIAVTECRDRDSKECDGNIYNSFNQPSRNGAAERG